MSNGKKKFSILSFFLGLAIGLWISVVVLFLADWNEPCDCGIAGDNVTNVVAPQYAWIPGGDGNYYCANSDRGRPVVVDRGRAVVADRGRSVVGDRGRSAVGDRGRAVVGDRGRAVVADASGHLPAPDSSPDQFGGDRGFEDFECATNEFGGATILGRAGRAAVVSMPAEYADDRCAKLNGSAIVTNVGNVPIWIDADGEVVVDPNGDISIVDSDRANSHVILDEDAPQSDPPLAYCMVAKAGSDPIVLRPTGTP